MGVRSGGPEMGGPEVGGGGGGQTEVSSLFLSGVFSWNCANLSFCSPQGFCVKVFVGGGSRGKRGRELRSSVCKMWPKAPSGQDNWLDNQIGHGPMCVSCARISAFFFSTPNFLRFCVEKANSCSSFSHSTPPHTTPRSSPPFGSPILLGTRKNI